MDGQGTILEIETEEKFSVKIGPCTLMVRAAVNQRKLGLEPLRWGSAFFSATSRSFDKALLHINTEPLVGVVLKGLQIPQKNTMPPNCWKCTTTFVFS